MHDDDEDEHSELQYITTSLVLGMRAYRSHGRVQEAGCTALAELVGDSDNTVAFVVTALVCAGAVHAVVEAMTGHMGDQCRKRAARRLKISPTTQTPLMRLLERGASLA